MAQFTVNAQRFDPYKNFKFRVKWDGRYVAGVSKVSALKRTTEVVKHREGGDPSTQPQVARAAPSTRRSRSSAASPTTPSSSSGRTRSGTSAPGLGAEVSLKDFRKDIIIEVYNEAGQLAHRLQGLPLLGLGVPGAARPRRQRQRRRDPAHQARERGLGARRERRRAEPSRPSPADAATRPGGSRASAVDADSRGPGPLDAWERRSASPRRCGRVPVLAAATGAAAGAVARWSIARARRGALLRAAGAPVRAARRGRPRVPGVRRELEFEIDLGPRRSGPRGPATRRRPRCDRRPAHPLPQPEQARPRGRRAPRARRSWPAARCSSAASSRAAATDGRRSPPRTRWPTIGALIDGDQADARGAARAACRRAATSGARRSTSPRSCGARWRRGRGAAPRGPPTGPRLRTGARPTSSPSSPRRRQLYLRPPGRVSA